MKRIKRLNIKEKNEKKANYHAEANYKKEKIKVNVEYISEKQIGVSKSSGTAERIQQIKKKIKDLKTTNVYQILAAKRVTLVKISNKNDKCIIKKCSFSICTKIMELLK